MNEKSSDYKNGYNDCAERLINKINDLNDANYYSWHSIQAVLLDLKDLVLRGVYRG